MNKKFHFIYKTTCIITNKFYIGMHSTNKLDDGYLGSGKKLSLSVNKHGAHNHIREILEYLPDRHALTNREKEIVNEELLKDIMCMNLTIGGSGEFSNRIKGNKTLHLKLKNDIEYRKRFCAKISLANSVSQLGEKNSQFGTKWIHKYDTQETIKIKSENLEKYLCEGWVLGRYKLPKKPRIRPKKEINQHHTLGRIVITDGKQNKFIFEVEFENFENSGWKKGMTKIKNSTTNTVTVNNGLKNKFVPKDEIELFLIKNKEYKLGKIYLNIKNK